MNRLTEKDLTRIVKRVIKEQTSVTTTTTYYPGVNPTLKPDFNTMNQKGTNSDASNNKVWKELKPEIEKITGQKFKTRVWHPGYMGPVINEMGWVEDNMFFISSQGVRIEIIYPASAVEYGVRNDGNFIDLAFWGVNTPMKYGGSCFDLSDIFTADFGTSSAEPFVGYDSDGKTGGAVKIWCKKEILDLIKDGMSKPYDGITKRPTPLY